MQPFIIIKQILFFIEKTMVKTFKTTRDGVSLAVLSYMWSDMFDSDGCRLVPDTIWFHGFWFPSLFRKMPFYVVAIAVEIKL